jgi:hypothetical protein
LLIQKASAISSQYMVGAQDPTSITAEQFRILYTWLEEANRSKGWKVFCITSAIQGEGKTFTAVNLALTMARDFKKKTLLIDADSRSAMLQRMTGMEDRMRGGWTDVVLKQCDLKEAIAQYADDNLYLLPKSETSVFRARQFTSLQSTISRVKERVRLHSSRCPSGSSVGGHKITGGHSGWNNDRHPCRTDDSEVGDAGIHQHATGENTRVDPQRSEANFISEILSLQWS